LIKDPRKEEFTFSTIYTYPDPDDDPVGGPSVKSLSAKESDEVFETVYSVVRDTGFIKNTKFRQLFICFEFIRPGGQPLYQVNYTHFKGAGSLCASLIVTEQELFEGFESNRVKFYIHGIAVVLQDVCHQYGLNSDSVQALIRKLGRTVAHAPYSQPVSELVITGDELHIHVRLEDEFPDEATFVANSNLIDELNALLRNTGAGSVTGSECGTGYETIFCEGADARAMYTAIRQVVPVLPSGSYLELFRDGVTDKIQL